MLPRLQGLWTDDGIQIAFSVFGSGPRKLVYVPRAAQTIGYMWEIPRYARFLERLGSTCEVMTLDVRGGGLSARDIPDDRALALEARAGDVRAVMDHLGWGSASFFGVEDGAATALMLAAVNPELVERLVLFGAYAKGLWAEDSPYAWNMDEWDDFLSVFDDPIWNWEVWVGQAAALIPSHLDDEELVRRTLYLYSAGAPRRAIWEVQRDQDIRALLPSIEAPTLVIDRVDNLIHEPGAGDYLAEHLPRGERLLLPGADFEVYAGDSETLADEILRFVTEGAAQVPSTRVLASVLVTDVVSSTEWVQRQGDDSWRRTLAAHDQLVRRVVEEHGGREIDNAGDGFLVVFDGPARAAYAGLRICDLVHRETGLELRAGVHVGEVELEGDRIRGLTVHVGARIGALAAPREVLVSSLVKDLTPGSSLQFVDRGEHVLKGVDTPIRLYAAAGHV